MTRRYRRKGRMGGDFRILGIAWALVALLPATAIRAGEPADAPRIPALLEALAGTDLETRRNAIRTLGGLGTQALPALEPVLAEGSWWAREGAMEALAGMGSAGLPVLARTARSDPRIEARRFAVRMIGGIRSREARQTLSRLRKDRRLRAVAASALGDSGDPAAIPDLLGMLADPSRAVRRASAAALGRLRDPGSAESLARLLADAHGSVRYAAARSLVSIGAQALPALGRMSQDPDPRVRALSVEAIGSIGGADAAPRIRPFARDPDWEVRASAAEALGRTGDSADFEPLRNRMGRETDRFVAARLQRALKRLGDR